MKNPHVLDQPRGSRSRVDTPLSVVVAGGGIAGLAAATVLAERGANVTLVEVEEYLGGRAGSWVTDLADGSTVHMERGFHAFFRHYYNLRALLRRADPELDRLVPVDDYPICAPGGRFQSFKNLPTRPPANFMSLVRRADSFPLRELLRVNGSAALEMLRYDGRRTADKFDEVPASRYLDSLRFPAGARQMLFDVFAHSFFNAEEEMSAAELLLMFHYYFMANVEGLVFDVLDDAFGASAWDPLGRNFESMGGVIRRETRVVSIAQFDSTWSVAITTNNHLDEHLQADAVILALPVGGLQNVIEASPGVGGAAWREAVARLELTRSFAVWRLWLARASAAGRHPFVGTAGYGVLDNISLYHLFERESRDWAARTGGSVVELHAYAVRDEMPDEEVREEMLAGLKDLYPELTGAEVVDERYLRRRDCPAFRPGSHGSRPGVRPDVRGLALAGDFIRLPFPSALMERAASSGFLAANAILALRGVDPEPIYTVAPRGPLSGRLPF